MEEKKIRQEKAALMQKECKDKIKPLEDELSNIIKKLVANLLKFKGSSPVKAAPIKFGRGQPGSSIKELLRSNPGKTFKLREIADALNTK